MSSLHYADKKYYISSSTYNQIKSLWQWLINFNITFNIENFQQVPFVSQTWVQHMALWQAIVHLRIHAKILVQESRSHWFLNRNRIAPFPCRSTYLKDILQQFSSHLINWKEGGSRHVEIRSILGWIMFDRSDLTEIAGLMWAHTHPYHYYLQIYRFTEVSPCPMANNVLCVVYSNKKIAASAPGWVSRNGPLGTGAHTGVQRRDVATLLTTPHHHQPLCLAEE